MNRIGLGLGLKKNLYNPAIRNINPFKDNENPLKHINNRQTRRTFFDFPKKGSPTKKSKSKSISVDKKIRNEYFDDTLNFFSKKRGKKESKKFNEVWRSIYKNDIESKRYKNECMELLKKLKGEVNSFKHKDGYFFKSINEISNIMLNSHNTPDESKRLLENLDTYIKDIKKYENDIDKIKTITDMFSNAYKTYVKYMGYELERDHIEKLGRIEDNRLKYENNKTAINNAKNNLDLFKDVYKHGIERLTYIKDMPERMSTNIKKQIGMKILSESELLFERRELLDQLNKSDNDDLTDAIWTKIMAVDEQLNEYKLKKKIDDDSFRDEYNKLYNERIKLLNDMKKEIDKKDYDDQTIDILQNKIDDIDDKIKNHVNN